MKQISNLSDLMQFILKCQDTPTELNLGELKKEVDIYLKVSYIKSEPFNSLVLAEALSYLAGQIREEVNKEIPLVFPEDKSTIEYGGSKITLRRTPEYAFPKDAKIERFKESIEALKGKRQVFDDEIKEYNNSIKTIQQNLIEQGKALIKRTKHSIIIK